MMAPPPAPAAVTVTATATAPAPSLVALIQTPGLNDPSISPDGRWVAYRRTEASVETNSYKLSWWVAPLVAAGPPRRLADGGEAMWSSGGTPVPEPPQWSPDSQRLYYRALVAGQVQVWDVGLDGSAAVAVTADAAAVEAFQLLDGGRLVYRTGASRAAILRAEADETAHGVRIDPSIDVGQDLTRGGLVYGRLAPQRLTGGWFDRTGLLGNAPKRFTVVDLDGRGAHPAAAAEIARLSDPTPLQGRLAPVAGFGGQVARLDGASRLTLADGAGVVRAQRFSMRITAFRWRPDHDQLVVNTADPAQSESLWLWDLAKGRVSPLAQADGVLNDSTREGRGPCPLDAAVMVCVAASALQPDHLVRIDLDTGQAVELDRSQATPSTGPQIEARTLAWKDAQGRRFGGVLVLPATRAAAPRLPLFVTYYQCPGYLRGGSGDEWPLAPLAARGVAALCIDKTTDAREPGNAPEAYEAALSGVRSIVERLVANGLVDRARIGMGGLSFGSEATMWVVTHSDLLAAVSLASPQLEPDYYWFNGVAGRTNHAALLATWGVGDPEATPSAWAKISPALQVDRVRTAVLMQLPEQEFRYQMELYAKLSNSPVPVDMYVFADEPHNKVQPVHRLAVYQRNLDWFTFWLKDEVDPDPLKAEQYRRWEAQRQAWRASPQAPEHPRSQISTSASSNNR